MTPYHFSVTIDGEFGAAVERTRTALADQGFGIVSEIDMAATLEEKLGVEFPPYTILGACNPGFAQKALLVEPSIGVLLPCNVVVRQTDNGSVMVDFMDPAMLVSLVGKEQLHMIADEVRTRLEMARDKIATG